MPDPAREWKWLALVVGVLVVAMAPVVVVLTTGGDRGGHDRDPVSVEPADYIGYDVGNAADGSLDLPPDAAYLSGPHFAVRFDTLQISTSTALGVRVADGCEFLRLTASGPGSLDTSAGGVTAQVVVDGAARPVDLARAQVSGLIVSVPTGHAATLQVTDEGRTQTLDLRTGTRGTDAIPGYYPAHVLSWKTADYRDSGRISVKGCHREMIFSLDFFRNTTAVLPWSPDVGWAQPGRASLPISYAVLTRPQELFDEADLLNPACDSLPNLDWDLGHSVGVQTPQGELAPARVVPSSAGGTLMFDVPVSLTSATLVVHPALTYRDGGERRPVRWTTPPPTARTEMVAE